MREPLNVRTDEPIVPVRVDGWEVKAYHFQLGPSAAASLFTHLIHTRRAELLGAIFRGDGSLWVAEDYLEDFLEVFDHLGILTETASQYERYRAAITSRSHTPPPAGPSTG